MLRFAISLILIISLLKCASTNCDQPTCSNKVIIDKVLQDTEDVFIPTPSMSIKQIDSIINQFPDHSKID